MSFDYSGVIHVHTNWSEDSDATVQDVVRFARLARADFVIIADHNCMGARKQAGWHEGVLIVVGEEVSPSEGNHYLAFGIKNPIHPGGSAQQVIDQVNTQGGFGFIAHPFFGGNHRLGIPMYRWLDWGVNGFTGIELLDYTCDGVERKNFLTYLLSTVFPWLHVHRPNPKTLRKWDELAGRRQIVAIGTADAHLYRLQVGPWRVPVHPFMQFFSCVRTHITTAKPFSGNAQLDSEIVYSALRRGSCYISNDSLADPSDLVFQASSGPDSASMGQRLRLHSPAVFKIEIPGACRIRLLRDGTEVARTRETVLHFESDTPGVYRAEAYRRHFLRLAPWVYTNPIYVAG